MIDFLLINKMIAGKSVVATTVLHLPGALFVTLVLNKIFY
jgi:hypothetical protein